LVFTYRPVEHDKLLAILVLKNQNWVTRTQHKQLNKQANKLITVGGGPLSDESHSESLPRQLLYIAAELKI